MERLTVTLHVVLYKFVISSWIRLRVRNFSDKSCGENQNTRLLVNKFLAPPPIPTPSDNRAVYGTVLKCTVQPDRPQMTI